MTAGGWASVRGAERVHASARESASKMLRAGGASSPGLGVTPGSGVGAATALGREPGSAPGELKSPGETAGDAARGSMATDRGGSALAQGAAPTRRGAWNGSSVPASPRAGDAEPEAGSQAPSARSPSADGEGMNEAELAFLATVTGAPVVGDASALPKSGASAELGASPESSARSANPGNVRR
jgi:hypothetical protein